MQLPHHRHSWRTWTWSSYLKLLERSRGPILVGPFYGEVGFEALYWQPFVAKIIERCGKDRVFPICRGGTARWYGTPHGVELYAMRPLHGPDGVNVAIRKSHAKNGYNKQDRITAFDRGVIRDAADTLGFGSTYHVVHPAWMYHRLAGFWTGYQGIQDVGRVAVHGKLPPPDLPPGLTLPERFCAVQFYARNTFPINPLTQQFVEATLATIAAQVPVILLETPFLADDHPDVPATLPANVSRLTDLMVTPPETNLWIKSAILARATAFVGTYGGLAQLALRFGVPSVSFYLQWGQTSLLHHTLATTLAMSAGVPYQVFRLPEIGLTRSVLPLIQEVAPTSRTSSAVETVGV